MKELWQMASNWLYQVGVLPGDSPALLANARVYDLAMALQDGTVLCKALNKLQANCVENVHEHPEKQFLRMQNINNFLSTCTSSFGLKPDVLFSAEELYYATDFSKVVSALSLLSKTQIAGLAGFKFFPADNQNIENRAEEDGEDMYGTLQGLVQQSLSLEEAAKTIPVIDNDEMNVEKIYGAISTMVEQGSEDVYNETLYAPGEAIYSQGGTTQDEKRNCVLSELHDTERNYVKILQTIIQVFRDTILKDGKAISKADCSLIFSNIDTILDTHQQFLSELDTNLASVSGRIVSTCFISAIQSFRCYGTFCSQIPDALKKLNELAARPAAAKLLDQARANSGQRFPLKDLLNVPMQRILKYPLLLKELIKYTPEKHPDKERLPVALTETENLARYINEKKKEFEELRQMVESLKGYSGKPLNELGALIRDGDVVYKCETMKEKLKMRYIFLCTTAIIVCKAKGSGYFFKRLIDLAEFDYTIDSNAPFWGFPKEEQKQFDKHSHAWSLKGSKKGQSAVVHTFSTINTMARKKWVTSMENQLQVVKDSRTGPPALAPRVSARDLSASIAAARSPSTSAGEGPRRQLSGPSASTSPAPTATTPVKRTAYEQWTVTSPPAGSPAPTAAADAGGAGAKVTEDDSWFAGKLPRQKAERILENAPDGAYLVRESDSRPGDYSLSIKYKIVKHIKINRVGKKYELAPDAQSFSTVQELVQHFHEHSLNRHFPGMETTLAIPFRDIPLHGAVPKPGVEGTSRMGRARARFPYVAKHPDELTFERGTELDIISTEDQDPGWWKGALPNGQVGIFPANYVQRL
eukprot:m.162985 g.162985  ORF g.162985 m.162985 type:complete len:812 (+) comp17104_c0_seq1:358-2793(+)